jgi:hypothetical protein
MQNARGTNAKQGVWSRNGFGSSECNVARYGSVPCVQLSSHQPSGSVGVVVALCSDKSVFTDEYVQLAYSYVTRFTRNPRKFPAASVSYK